MCTAWGAGSGHWCVVGQGLAHGDSVSCLLMLCPGAQGVASTWAIALCHLQAGATVPVLPAGLQRVQHGVPSAWYWDAQYGHQCGCPVLECPVASVGTLCWNPGTWCSTQYKDVWCQVKVFCMGLPSA